VAGQGRRREPPMEQLPARIASSFSHRESEASMNVRQGFPKRFLAGLIDFVIVFVAMLVVGVLFHSAPRLLMILSPALVLCYMALEVVKAQSVGKMVMKLKITNQDGSDAPKDALMKRFAVKYAGSIIQLVGGIVGLYIISTLGMLAG